MKIDIMDGTVNSLRVLACNHAKDKLDGDDSWLCDPEAFLHEELQKEYDFYCNCTSEELINHLLIIVGCAFQHPEYNYFEVKDWRV